MAAQRFSDPQMPFHREVHNGCAIGTSIVITAKAYQDQKKSLELQLKSRGDIALNLVIPLNRAGQLSVNARVNDQYTSEIQKPINVPLNATFALHIRIDTHVSEIYLNDTHLLDFVHRVNPLEIREVSIEGPLIISEVVFKPPSGASLETLPSYDEASRSVVPEFQNLSIGPSQSTVPPVYRGPNVIPPPPSVAPPPIPVAAMMSGPAPAGTVVPRGAMDNKPPYPEKNYPGGGAPALPDKKNIPPPATYPPPPPMAQVAPQPTVPPLSTMPVQNRSPTAYPPNPPNPVSPLPPPQQAPVLQYPPPPPMPGQQYPPHPPPVQPQPAAPGGYIPSAPPGGPATNVYPGPNPLPGQPGMYNPYAPGPSAGYYPQQPAYPMYQQGYPQTYVQPTYPMYSYPSVYYDDCHHHHHC